MNQHFKKILIVFSISGMILSCNKDDNDTNDQNGQTGQTSCASNDGYFNINVEGTNYDMVVDAAAQFSILYNWFGLQESAFIIDATDQNANPIYVELALPGTFNVGTKAYSNDSLDFDFFDIDVDTFGLYVSHVTFEVSESNLNTQDGMYTPVAATFNGTAHSYPWYSGVPPVDTLSINGSFCLNGIIMP